MVTGMRALQAVYKNPVRLGIVVTQIEHPDFGGPEAGMVGHSEDGAIPDGRDHRKQPLNVLFPEERSFLPLVPGPLRSSRGRPSGRRCRPAEPNRSVVAVQAA